MRTHLLTIIKACAVAASCTMGVLVASASNGHPGVAATTQQEVQEEVVFFEDFSGCTAALADSVPLRNTSTGLLDPELLGEEGWWGNFAYCSEGAVALAYPNYGGFISTPYMNLYGKVTVSFRYKVRPGNKNIRNFWVHVDHGNPSVSEPVVDLKHSSVKVDYMPFDADKWQDFSYTFDNPYSGDDTFVQINAQFAPETGIEIDDLKITRNPDFVTIPTSLRVSEVMSDGFTAAWNPGAENKSYLVTCIEQKVLSEDLQEYSETFNADTLPEGWIGEGCTVVAGAGFDGKNAVELALDQTLYGPVNYSIVKNLKFSIKPKDITDMYGMSVVMIEGLTESGVWEAPSEIMLLLVPAEGMVIDIAEQAPKFLDKYIGFGLKFFNYLGDESGKVLISDVNWTTDGSLERKILLEKQVVNEPSVSVYDIDPEGRQFIQVAGVNGELVSEFTPMMEIIGVPAPTNVEAHNESMDELSYTANWSEVQKADAGYVVRNYIVTTASEDVPGYTVMKDSFSTDIPGVMYIEDRTLDNYTDVQGWTVESKPGCTGYAKVGGDQLGGDGRAIIISPEMALTNNNGDFVLEFTLAGHGDVILDVNAGNETQTVVMDGGYDWEKNEESYGEKRYSLTFHSGEINSRIRFSSPNWHAFMLSDLSVKQDIVKDENIYRLDRIFDVVAGTNTLDVDNKEVGPNIYAFGVQSLMKNGTAAPYESKVVMSEPIDFRSSGVDFIEANAASIGTSNGRIWIEMPHAGDIVIYSTSGLQVCRMNGHVGRNVSDSLTSGMYIVKALNRTYKVII